MAYEVKGYSSIIFGHALVACLRKNIDDISSWLCEQKRNTYFNQEYWKSGFLYKKSQLPWLPYSSSIKFSIHATDGKGGFISLDRVYPVWDTFVD